MQYWSGPAPQACDLCKQPVKLVFVDGAAVMGPWACMCNGRAARYGVGLGQGKGQQYRKGHGGKWFKAVG